MYCFSNDPAVDRDLAETVTFVGTDCEIFQDEGTVFCQCREGMSA